MSRVTFGCAGHGLLFAPVSPCRLLVTEDDELVIAHGAEEVARIAPGDVPASAAASWVDGTGARFGEGGPLLELAASGTFGEILERVDGGCAPEAFELHALGGEDELIAFERIETPADRVNIAPARYQKLVEKGVFQVRSPDGVRQLGIVELAYDVAEQPWRQIVIPVPLDAGSTMLVKAQAHEWRVPTFFPPQHVAATLGRLG